MTKITHFQRAHICVLLRSEETKEHGSEWDIWRDLLLFWGRQIKNCKCVCFCSHMSATSTHFPARRNEKVNVILFKCLFDGLRGRQLHWQLSSGPVRHIQPTKKKLNKWMRTSKNTYRLDHSFTHYCLFTKPNYNTFQRYAVYYHSFTFSISIFCNEEIVHGSGVP